MSVKKLNDVKTVKEFCYLGNTLNASGGSEMTAKARTRIGLMRFREYGKVLSVRRVFDKNKGEKVRDLSKVANTVGK